MFNISKEAENVLYEILDNENNSDYWKNRFIGLSKKDDSILRGCFKELKDNNLVNTQWADNIPWVITVLKDGYLYKDKQKENKQVLNRINMTEFEKALDDLLKRINDNSSNNGIDPKKIWINDLKIFADKYLKKHSLYQSIQSNIFHQDYKNLIAQIYSISKDKDFINEMNGFSKTIIPKYKANTMTKYDVFISHANKDKKELVDELYASLNKLGIDIFYDKDTIEWGDNWKDKILEGTKKSEFAIIVISENFFGREWTEKELQEFLNRQNTDGQKIILPILHNITIEDLIKKYPSIANIQAISSKDMNCDDIAIAFAKQLIRRLKAQ